MQHYTEIRQFGIRTAVNHKKKLLFSLRLLHISVAFSGVPRNFVGGGVQQIQLRTEDRENGDLGAVAL